MKALRGLYAITLEHAGTKSAAQVERAIAGGAQVIQYRDKSEDHRHRL